MFEQFETYMNNHGVFTAEDLQLMRSQVITKKIRRRQVLLHEGEVCRCKIFVCKGLLRTYSVKDDGTEYIMRFAAENGWITEPASYHSQMPSDYNIDAMEDTEAMLWTREAFDELCNAIPNLKYFSETIRARSFEDNQQRILMNISYSAEEKYEAFIASFPDVFRRVPLHMVASYLGVSRETLSRIRHAQMKRMKGEAAG